MPASIGIAWSSDPDLDADALVGRADTAVDKATRSGSGSGIIFRASGA